MTILLTLIRRQTRSVTIALSCMLLPTVYGQSTMRHRMLPPPVALNPSIQRAFIGIRGQLFFTPQYVPMPFTHAGGGSNTFTHISNPVANATNVGTFTTQVVLTNPPGTGHLVIVGCETSNNGVSSPVPTVAALDGSANVYTVAAPSGSPIGNVSSFNGFAALAYLASAPAGASATITFTWTAATGGFGGCLADEFSYTQPSTTYDNGATANSGGTPITTPTIPVSGSNDLVYSMLMANNSAMGVGGSWTANAFGAVSSSLLTGYQPGVSTGTAVDFTLTGPFASAAEGISFK